METSLICRILCTSCTEIGEDLESFRALRVLGRTENAMAMRAAVQPGLAALASYSFLDAQSSSCAGWWPFGGNTPPPTGLGSEHPRVIVKFRPAGTDETKLVAKLEYFCLQGYGETSRLLLEATNTPHDSIMYFTSKEYKKTAPFGQMPIYTDASLNGATIAQRGAVARHIARVTGSYGKNLAEQAQVDQLYELSNDITSNKAGVHALAIDVEHPKRAKLESFLAAAENLCPQPHSYYNTSWVGSKLSLADVALFFALSNLIEATGSEPAADATVLSKSYPKLAAFVKAFAAKKEIREYLESERRVPLTKNEIDDKPWAPGGYEFVKPLKPGTHATPFL